MKNIRLTQMIASEVLVGRAYFCDKKEETKPSASDFLMMEDDDDALPFA